MATPETPPSPPLPVAVSGLRIYLRPVTQDDLVTLFRWRVQPPNVYVPGRSARIPPYEEFAGEFARRLRESVHLLVLDRPTLEPIGFVQAYNVNLEAGWCFVSVLTDEPAWTTATTEAYARFLDLVFRTYGFRKVCVDVYDRDVDNLRPLMSAGLAEEGRFHEHVWSDGEYKDIVRLAVFQDEWREGRQRAMTLLGVAEDAAQLLTDATKDRIGS